VASVVTAMNPLVTGAFAKPVADISPVCFLT